MTCRLGRLESVRFGLHPNHQIDHHPLMTLNLNRLFFEVACSCHPDREGETSDEAYAKAMMMGRFCEYSRGEQAVSVYSMTVDRELQ